MDTKWNVTKNKKHKHTVVVVGSLLVLYTLVSASTLKRAVSFLRAPANVRPKSK